jgi:integrase/recombinase XerD
MNQLTPYKKAEIVESIPFEDYKDPFPKYITKDDVELILTNVDNKRVRLLLAFLWNTGLRISEALSVRVKDYDSQTQTLKIRHLKSRQRKMRPVVINSRFAKGFEFFLSSFTNKEELVFPFTRQNVDSMIRKACDGLELSTPVVSAHTFRHGFAVNYLKQGGRIEVLKKLLGHARIDNTMVYADIVGSDLRKEIDRIEF